MADDDGSDVVLDRGRSASRSSVAGDAVESAVAVRHRSLRTQGERTIFIVAAHRQGWLAALRHAAIPGGPPDLDENDGDDGEGPYIVGTICGTWDLRSIAKGQASEWATEVATSAARVGVEVFGHVSYEGEGVALS